MMTPKICSHCGNRLPVGSDWPKTCRSCSRTTWLNAVPAANLLLPVEGGGVLLGCRGIDPGYGKLGVPGGYMDRYETWQECAVRETKEETLISIKPDEVALFGSLSFPPAPIVLFGASRRVIRWDEIPNGPYDETLELVVVSKDYNAEYIAFQSHRIILDQFFTMVWNGDVEAYHDKWDNRWTI